jgi:hypothetical protein
VNVLCANVDRADLKGLIYEDQVNGALNSSSDLNTNWADPHYFVNAFDWDEYASVKTQVDSIFNWNDVNKRPSRCSYYPFKVSSAKQLKCFIGIHCPVGR